PPIGARPMTALAVTRLNKSFGGLRVTATVDLMVEPGDRRLIIGPIGAGKTTPFNLINAQLSSVCCPTALLGRFRTRHACGRTEIAMALAQNPKVLLLDQPIAGLSIDKRREVQKLLAAIPRQVTVVMIEHNMDVALDLADRITLLHFGEVIVEGTRAQVVADPRTREVYLGH